MYQFLSTYVPNKQSEKWYILQHSINVPKKISVDIIETRVQFGALLYSYQNPKIWKDWGAVLLDRRNTLHDSNASGRPTLPLHTAFLNAGGYKKSKFIILKRYPKITWVLFIELSISNFIFLKRNWLCFISYSTRCHNSRHEKNACS